MNHSLPDPPANITSGTLEHLKGHTSSRLLTTIMVRSICLLASHLQDQALEQGIARASLTTVSQTTLSFQTRRTESTSIWLIKWPLSVTREKDLFLRSKRGDSSQLVMAITSPDTTI